MSSLHQVAEVLELQPQPQPSCQASVCSSVFVSSQQRCGGTDIKAPSAIPALGSWTDRVIALRSRRDCVLALRQISVTALFYLEDSKRIHPQSVRACQPKDTKRREWRSTPARERQRETERVHTCWGERESPLAPLFVFFFPLGLPYANWA